MAEPPDVPHREGAHALPGRRVRLLPWAGAVLGMTGLGVGIWLGAGHTRPGGGVAGGGHASPPVETVARTRALSPSSACLLTDSGGVSRPPASLVWKGMSKAAEAAKARVSLLPAPGSLPVAPMLNALVAQRCSVIVGVGGAPVAAVNAAEGAKHPGVRFAVAETTGAASGVTGFAPTAVAASDTVGRLLAEVRGHQ